MSLPSSRPTSRFGSLGSFAGFVRDIGRLIAALPVDWLALFRKERRAEDDDPETRDLARRADEARAAGRREEAAVLYRAVRGRRPGHVGALRALRDLAAEAERWPEALDAEEALLEAVPASERAAETEWLAAFHYEQGRHDMGAGRIAAAIPHFRQAVRIDRGFVPASLALGDALEATGDMREAVRVWERAAEREPSLPVLARLERAYRLDGRPSRMIALYRSAVERAPDDLAIAVALGRVYFELEMLDEAADHFEKLEVRAPSVPVVHSFLGAIFERRGETPEAFEEYRKALRLAQAFTWPHRCGHCRALTTTWEHRCPHCGRWNRLRPVDLG
ncbi:MAG: tetratricopeptide repeat protein [Candidatus Rokubacteria bacterium]|nr:tetratricopeptide repeat protein [Candidatus Rokubacteria bacterium]